MIRGEKEEANVPLHTHTDTGSAPAVTEYNAAKKCQHWKRGREEEEQEKKEQFKLSANKTSSRVWRRERDELLNSIFSSRDFSDNAFSLLLHSNNKAWKACMIIGSGA